MILKFDVKMDEYVRWIKNEKKWWNTVIDTDKNVNEINNLIGNKVRKNYNLIFKK